MQCILVLFLWFICGRKVKYILIPWRETLRNVIFGCLREPRDAHVTNGNTLPVYRWLCCEDSELDASDGGRQVSAAARADARRHRGNAQ